jgi:hypothetical protein
MPEVPLLPVPINAVLLPSFPIPYFVLSGTVVSHSDGILHVELSFLVGRRARAGVCIPVLHFLSVLSCPPITFRGCCYFLVDSRFGIGSDQDQQERESVMATLWGIPCPGMAIAQQLRLTRGRGTERWSNWPRLQCALLGCTGSGANTDCERKHLERLLAQHAAV